MLNVNDVAAYILEKQGEMTAMKLQKLVYYSQAWHLVWEEVPLFPEKIEAWANGPVIPKLFAQHAGTFTLRNWRGDPRQLDDSQRGTVDAVLQHYGDKSPQWLSDLTHRERPWRDARGDTPPGERCRNQITLEAMTNYYAAIAAR